MLNPLRLQPRASSLPLVLLLMLMGTDKVLYCYLQSRLPRRFLTQHRRVNGGREELLPGLETFASGESTLEAWPEAIALRQVSLRVSLRSPKYHK